MQLLAWVIHPRPRAIRSIRSIHAAICQQQRFRLYGSGGHRASLFSWAGVEVGCPRGWVQQTFPQTPQKRVQQTLSPDTSKKSETDPLPRHLKNLRADTEGDAPHEPPRHLTPFDPPATLRMKMKLR
jgi:hypothetical protein